MKFLITIFVFIITLSACGLPKEPLYSEKTSDFIPTTQLQYIDSPIGVLQDDISIKMSKIISSRLTREPELTDQEKNEIMDIFTKQVPSLFVKKPNNTFMSKNLYVKSIRLEAETSSNTHPPKKSEISGINVRVTYEIRNDWFQTTHFELFESGTREYKRSSTAPITLEFRIIDYKSGKFVKRDKISAVDPLKYQILKRGFPQIISEKKTMGVITIDLKKKKIFEAGKEVPLLYDNHLGW